MPDDNVVTTEYQARIAAVFQDATAAHEFVKAGEKETEFFVPATPLAPKQCPIKVEL